MKRTALLTAILAIAFLAMTALGFAQPNPSVPNLVNFQGRLTDNLGNPVANGAHTVVFRIYDSRTLGALLWTESQTPTTTGGLFTTQLGSVDPVLNPLPPSLFEDYDSLFLELEADAQLISPRTLLTSTPSTRVANAIEHFNPITGIVDLKNFDSGHGIKTYGGDGLDQIWLYGYSWGELFLYDSDVSNDLTARLSANNTVGGPTGGQLELSGGPSYFNLNAGDVGDAAALLPTDAVNSGEILDEPGIASSFQYGLYVLTFATTSTDTVTITAPSTGYVVITAQGFFGIAHTLGTEDIVRAYISDIAGDADFDNFAIEEYPSNAATPPFAGYRTFTLTKVEAVGPGSHTYYLNADKFSGAGTIERRHLTATFFPTNYGTVVSTIAAQPRVGANVSTAANPAGTNQPSEVRVTTVAEHQAKLEAARAKQMAELEARIKQLEEQVKSGQYPNLAPETPRKER